MAKTITGQVLVTSASVAAAGTSRAALDVSGADGGEIRFAITNGATGPTLQCVASVLVARKQSSMPSAAAEGTGDDNWKRRYSVGGTVTASTKTFGSFRFGPEVAYIQIEFTGHTGQAVTVECTGDTYVY